jgi:hypothetical protein
MLDTDRKGYAVMSKDLSAISFDDETVENCKRYCREGYVIAERIPYVAGFNIRIFWCKWYRIINLTGYYPRNFFWIHWSTSKIHFHKTGKVVYSAEP